MIMTLTRKQYEVLNEELSHYYVYAIENMEKDEEGRLKENYPLGVYVGMAHGLSLLGIKLDRDIDNRVEISPDSVEFAGQE